MDKLLLKAYNEEGCDIISSLLQDSIFHITSHSFHEDKKCLRLMLNRFCWELVELKEDNNYDDHDSVNKNNQNFRNDSVNNQKSENHNQCYYRVHCGLYIHNVESISINDNFKKASEERYLNFLAMHACGNELSLLFSGHKNMCVKVSKLQIYLKDLHDKYPTAIRSVHNF